MYQKFIRATFLLLFGSLVQAQTSTPIPALKAEPRLLGASVISTADFEFNASFTPDGNTVYFSKSDPVFNRITIVLSRRKGGNWTTPQVASFSGVWKDVDPFLVPDGGRLFFASNRPINGGTAPKNDYDLWYVARTGIDLWGEPQHLGPAVNSDGNELYPSVTRDGILYFSATRPAHPGSHIYRSRLLGSKYGQPELLSFSTQANDLDSTIATDESFLVFISRDRGGLGAGDLYVSFRRPDGNWSTPKNLEAPISSPFHEIATGLSPDNRTMYFASNRIDGSPARTKRVNYKQLENELHAIQNGLMNIYEVNITNLKILDEANR